VVVDVLDLKVLLWLRSVQKVGYQYLSK